MIDFAVRYEKLRERIAAAATSSGRNPADISLVAVSKLQPVSAVNEALAAGLTVFGENYVQEALAKRSAIDPAWVPEWHLIGHLQRNKAKAAVVNFDLIESVDSVELCREIGRHALSIGKMQPILLQVHLGDEETKSGFAPENLLGAAAAIFEVDGVQVRGLMGVAPYGTDPRPFFRKLRELFEQLPAANKTTLSMGMSGDFEAAIEEGATSIRIGTALFGKRQ